MGGIDREIWGKTVKTNVNRLDGYQIANAVTRNENALEKDKTDEHNRRKITVEKWGNIGIIE
jgi:hypothetical protein